MNQNSTGKFAMGRIVKSFRIVKRTNVVAVPFAVFRIKVYAEKIDVPIKNCCDWSIIVNMSVIGKVSDS